MSSETIKTNNDGNEGGGKPPTNPVPRATTVGSEEEEEPLVTYLSKPKTSKDRQLSWGDQQQQPSQSVPPIPMSQETVNRLTSTATTTPPRPAAVNDATRASTFNTADRWISMVKNTQVQEEDEPYSPLTPASTYMTTQRPLSDRPPLLPNIEPPPPKREIQTHVSLADVRGGNHEAEAIESIVYAMEKLAHQNQQRDRGFSVDSGTRILQNVPDDATSFQQQQSPPEKASDTRSATSKASKISSAATSKHSTTSEMHRRNKTMESTLFGLTQAMAAMHRMEEGSNDGSDNDDDDDDIHHLNPSATASQFDQSATLVFRGKSDAEKEEAKIQAHKHWGALKTTLQMKAALSEDEERDLKMPLSTIPSNSALTDMEEGHSSGALGESNRTDENDDPKKTDKRKSKTKTKAKKKAMQQAGQGLVSDAREFTQQRKSALRAYLWTLMLLVVPAIGISFILFYLAGNPPTGRIEDDSKLVYDFETNTTILVNTNGEEFDAKTASASWWILFLCVRQIITLSLAKMCQTIIIDFFCVSTRIFVNTFGQFFTLFIIQSRGVPFHMFFWSLWDLALLQGNTDFAKHWGQWQTYYFDNYLSIFTQANPSGGIPGEDWYRRLLIMGIGVGLAISVKRVWVGFMLGRKIYRNYSEDLAKLMKKLLLLGRVAFVARDLSRRSTRRKKNFTGTIALENYGFSEEQYNGLLRTGSEDNLNNAQDFSAPAPDSLDQLMGRVIEVNDPRDLSQADRNRINEYLGAWEDPEKELGVEDSISIDAILQFRQSLSFLDNRFLFSIAWGDTSTRESTIISSQEVYHRLNVLNPDTSVLRFDVLALATVDESGEIDPQLLKDLIRLLRPDREGYLTLLEFVKSVDAVYREAKLLRAAVHNSEKVDRAFENVINVIFYVTLGCILLSQSGVSPMALFISMSSFILAFAFVIGSAMSKMFEGWLFILLQRPYDIGDRIHVSNVQVDTNSDGSPGWIVKDVTLFNTTLVYGVTNERATLSNSSMANSRILNMARSPNAQVFVFFKFSVEVEYEKVEVFQQALRKFVRARPREWANFAAFRPTKIMADLGYIEYITILVHRESWQNVGAVNTSKAEVASFGLELSKKLDMRYKSPPLPVNLNMMQGERALMPSMDSEPPKMVTQESSNKAAGHHVHSASDLDSIMAMFEKDAK
ncbi:hypothetical protein FisN_9Lh385 [Fistulifera solaris]|uniref:Mechanosensitive ion channel MscS domain-containing protein n=1 Tax=Fistulifera solaris TaxID=1519565 RepID=A0A1Z5KL70_FISSO|nr:hypothetical protein FisN_9Lh385 [Fistulifera solaris]|eukprot:GAX27063.1 hypothetical protein FisN_9Lh385 [Fistulifera solaris]